MNNQNEKNNKPELPGETAEQKKAKINRAIYITTIVLLVAVALIAGVVSAANRAKKEPVETGKETPAITQPKPSTQTPNETSPEPESTPAPESTASQPNTSVSNKLPEFKLPVSGTLSVLHDPTLQVFSPTMQDYRVHLGVDINTSAGASVKSVAAGVVTKIWEDPMMGWCVAVSHDGEAISFYKNLDKNLGTGIKEGATVKAGQLLGAVGDSAMIEVAQEPHLHFEMTVKGLQVDPADYFSDAVWAELGGDNSYEG